MGKLATAREDMKILLASPPGVRFEHRYRRHHERRRRNSVFARSLYLALGMIVAAGSLLLAPLPGPGLATVFVGLGIVAGEHKPSAKLLDYSELHLRSVGRRVRRLWMGSGLTGRLAMMLTGAVMTAGLLVVAAWSVLLVL